MSTSPGCGNKEGDSVSAGSGHSTTAEHYVVRGVLERVDSGDSAAVVVHHEAIPDFKNQAGEVVGMASMTMRFETEADLSAVKPGDKIEMTVAVQWPKLKAQRIRKLPEDTALSFDAPAAPSE